MDKHIALATFIVEFVGILLGTWALWQWRKDHRIDRAVQAWEVTIRYNTNYENWERHLNTPRHVEHLKAMRPLIIELDIAWTTLEELVRMTKNKRVQGTLGTGNAQLKRVPLTGNQYGEGGEEHWRVQNNIVSNLRAQLVELLEV